MAKQIRWAKLEIFISLCYMSIIWLPFFTLYLNLLHNNITTNWPPHIYCTTNGLAMMKEDEAKRADATHHGLAWPKYNIIMVIIRPSKYNILVRQVSKRADLNKTANTVNGQQATTTTNGEWSNWCLPFFSLLTLSLSLGSLTIHSSLSLCSALFIYFIIYISQFLPPNLSPNAHPPPVDSLPLSWEIS